MTCSAQGLHVLAGLDVPRNNDITVISRLVITSRSHAMVAALAVGVPPLVVDWSHKYEEMLEIFACESDAVDFFEAEQNIPVLVERMLAE